jgi:hypothetical protein
MVVICVEGWEIQDTIRLGVGVAVEVRELAAATTEPIGTRYWTAPWRRRWLETFLLRSAVYRTLSNKPTTPPCWYH